ncbi:hypothetical protein F01_520041 [Burkholderia cenocepacia]|nr:hypothetical protein F01_520041 [Burkholderia cenocepacia]
MALRAHAAGRNRAGAHRFARALADPDPQRHVRPRDASLAGAVRARHGAGARARHRAVDAADGRTPRSRHTASRRTLVAHGRRARDGTGGEIATLAVLRISGNEVVRQSRHAHAFREDGRAAIPGDARVAGLPCTSTACLSTRLPE